MVNRLCQFGFVIWLLSCLLVSCETAPTIQPGAGTIEGIVDRSWAISSYLSGRSLDRIEGIWIWEDNDYEVAIVRNKSGIEPGYQFLGFITDTTNTGWRRGEVKLLLKETASSSVFSGAYLMRDKKRVGVTFLTTHPNLIELNLPTGPYGMKQKTLLIRVYPKTTDVKEQLNQEKSHVGSGFFVAPGIVATNYHVVADGKTIAINVAGAQMEGSLLLQDPRNDLALIRVAAHDAINRAVLKGNTSCLALGDADKAASGDRVYSLGFPLSGVLGSSVNASEGLINNTRGLQDDPRMFQVSVPIQPGSSGSPLFDKNGKVIGIVTSTLNNKYLFATQGTIPQNVNFAVKISYLRSMLALVPDARCEGSQSVGNHALNASDLAKLFSSSVVGIRTSR